jgi:hypothetical protein
MRFASKALMLLASVMSLSLAMPPAASANSLFDGDYPQFRPFQLFPACDEAGVLSEIFERQRYGERFAYRHGEILKQVDLITEEVIEAFGPAPILRRFCFAQASMSTGRQRKMYYMIEKGMGLAGTGYKVEFCITGLDTWGVYDGNCRVLRNKARTAVQRGPVYK